MIQDIKYWMEDPGMTQMYRAHPGDAGYDLRCQEDSVTVRPGSQRLVSTGLHVEIPEGCVGLCKSRSGKAVTGGIEVGAGVIDSNYRGPVNVLLHNFGQSEVHFGKGDRIAQLLVLRLYEGTPVKVSSMDELSQPGERGCDGSEGFGSSGL